MNRDEATQKVMQMAGISKEEMHTVCERIVLMSKFSPVPYAERIMAEDKYFYDNYKRLWRYNRQEGIWVDDAELYIKSKLRKQLLGEEQQKKQYVDEIIEYIKGICWNSCKILDPPKTLIPFQNVIYDLEKEDFMEFTDEYFITSKIPIEIDPRFADCEIIDIFLEEIVGKDKKVILYELMAYCLYKSYPYQKFFILYGDGSNGKSAFLKLLIKFLGVSNISSEKPQSLINDRFSAANLYEKLANISPDIPYTELTDSSLIRELTGEDSLTCQKKFKDSFKFFNYAKIIFSANELPQVKDKNYAFNRRIYIILFDKKITNPDPEIIEKIATKSQLSGLAWQLIKILKEMKTRGYKFSLDPDVDEMSKLYEELSSSLVKFLKEHTVKDTTARLIDWEFKQKFEDWCTKKGIRVWRVGEINDFMRNRYRDTRVNQDFYDKEQGKFTPRCVHAWEGLKWKDN